MLYDELSDIITQSLGFWHWGKPRISIEFCLSLGSEEEIEGYTVCRRWSTLMQVRMLDLLYFISEDQNVSSYEGQQLVNRAKILALVKDKGGEVSYCTISQLEDIITEVLKQKRQKPDDQLFVTFQGCKYFLLRVKNLLVSSPVLLQINCSATLLPQECPLALHLLKSERSCCVLWCQKVYWEGGLKTDVLSDNKAFFFYKKKPSADIGSLAEWKSLKGAVRRAKVGADNITVLIWNSAAGFSENLDVIYVASLSFDYVAYFDWEVDAAVLNQKVSIIEGKELTEFLIKFMKILDKDQFNYLSYFWSMEQFKRICNQMDTPELSTRFQPVVKFLGHLIESLVQIKLRTSPRGRLIWKALVDVKPDDVDDLKILTDIKMNCVFTHQYFKFVFLPNALLLC
ncbi:hypothetical protein MIR68_001689 [Amoeboaphelidium protococcarum]|nr:hypothetical protein MIR68_001689 [Amoeboaphelidium protococcarum]